VAIGTDESPVSVSKTGDARRNVIVWMDHRAEEQAERINAFKSPVLQFAGGSLSPEHQAPKVIYFFMSNNDILDQHVLGAKC
jgi:ribulose kinase